MSVAPWLGLLLGLTTFLGCSQHTTSVPGEEDRPSAAEAETPEGRVEEPEASALPTLDPETACGRALACCEAFAAAFENVVASSACRGPVDASEAEDAAARCDRMTLGWRVALERHETASPPTACGDPEP